jgi:uncharacterized membrane protein
LAAEAALSAAPLPARDAASLPERFEFFGVMALFGMAMLVQFSIAIGQILLALAILCWIGMVLSGHERVQAPRFFWLLMACAGRRSCRRRSRATRVSASWIPSWCCS